MAAYLEHQLDYVARVFAQYGFLYEYYRSGACELDAVYFLRGVEFSGLIGVDLPPFDTSFSTLGDFLFSKFIALEQFRELVMGEMGLVVVSGFVPVLSKKGKELKWTGDITNLIELLYGLSETKQLNDGEIDISDVVDVFEQVFHVNLSNFYRRFTTIKRRKLVSKTRFLDEMRAAVAKRIDDADAYVPNWAK
ncbi:MAG: hypothetical protein EOO88_44335 [Pedobacter sp.]|nr:MAG: hypothetical protein EOO88_44335 [Pedobacter sp.]